MSVQSDEHQWEDSEVAEQPNRVSSMPGASLPPCTEGQLETCSRNRETSKNAITRSAYHLNLLNSKDKSSVLWKYGTIPWNRQETGLEVTSK